jgi:hypothetical protein
VKRELQWVIALGVEAVAGPEDGRRRHRRRHDGGRTILQ